MPGEKQEMQQMPAEMLMLALEWGQQAVAY